MDKRVTTFLYWIPGWLTPLLRGRRDDANAYGSVTNCAYYYATVNNFLKIIK